MEPRSRSTRRPPIARLFFCLSIFFACADRDHAPDTPAPAGPDPAAAEAHPGTAEETSDAGPSDLPVEPQPFWTYVTAGEIWSNPLIVNTPDPTWIVGGDDRYLHAVHPPDGSRKWRTRLQGRVRQAAIGGPDRLGVVDTDSRIYALNPESGEIEWRRQVEKGAADHWTGTSEIWLHGTADGHVVARSPRDGERRWKAFLGPTRAIRALSHGPNRVYAVAADGELHALRLRDGGRIWRRTLKGDARSAPIESAHRPGRLFANDGGFLWCLDADGQTLWRAQTNEFVSSPPVIAQSVDEDLVLVAGGNTLFAFSVYGEAVWNRSLVGAFRSGPVTSGAWVAVGSGDHWLSAHALDDGRELWSFETDAFITGALAAQENRLVFGSVGGKLLSATAEFASPSPETPLGRRVPGLGTPTLQVGDNFFDGTPRIVRQLAGGRPALPPVAIPPPHAPVGDRVWSPGRRVLHLRDDGLEVEEPASGKRLWRVPATFGARPPTPVVNADRVIAVTRDQLLSLALHDGRELWRAPLPPGQSSRIVALSPILGERVITVTDDGRVAAFHGPTGDLLWRRSAGAPIVSAPEVYDNVAVIGTTGGELLALQASDGRELWRLRAEGPWTASARRFDRLVFAVDGAGFAVALDPTIGGEIWRASLGGTFRHAPASHFSNLFFCSDGGRLSAINGLSGLLAWDFKLDSRCTAEPLVVDGIVYVGTEDPGLLAINAVNGEELWRLQTAAPVIGTVVGLGSGSSLLLQTVDRAGLRLTIALP